MRHNLFFPVVAALALAGCSNDDMPASGAGNNATDGEGAFLAVNIVAPTDMSKRAASDFVDGTGDENLVTTADFFIFDAAGKLKNHQAPELTWTDATNPENPAVEKISKAMLILNGKEVWEDTRILVLLNYTGDKFWESDGAINTATTLDNFLNQVADYSVKEATIDGAKHSLFLMSNSVYKDGFNGIATAVPMGEKVKSTSEAAEKDPVEIYVERAVAKVHTSKIDNTFNITNSEITLGSAKTTLIPVIKGIEVANVAKTSYLVKNISDYDFTWAWNDPSNYRSYWANIPAALEYTNQNWTQISKLSPASEQNFYIQENTDQTEINKTAVLITAQLTTDGSTPIEDLIRFAGNYYSVTDYAKIIAGQLKNKYVIKTTAGNETTYSSILPEHLEIYQAEGWKVWQVACRLTEAAKALTFVDAATHADATAANVDDELAKEYLRAWEWKDGMCYYYVSIDHFGTETVTDGTTSTTKNLQGIVRNHIYDLTLKDLKGLGVPVFDPEQTIIPERPSDDVFYLAARINILKWRVVSQDISFN